ncbi:MAG: dependent oxidoreductase [Ilumatobacteraceae bacterium]|nr:dependent oxidoreductase [Ilumatobacteraceae bacterium]
MHIEIQHDAHVRARRRRRTWRSAAGDERRSNAPVRQVLRRAAARFGTVSAMEQVDVVVIGAGIVGLSTAHAVLAVDPRLRVAIVDKEGSIAGHQTGRNSGVIHAGVYYKPGSEKARLCTAGRQRMVEFCAEHDIAHEICGKVVVAVSADERPRLAELHRRCVANGVDVELVGSARLRELEPHAAGIEALHVKVTGIADYSGVCAALATALVGRGAQLRLGAAVVGVASDGAALVVETSAGPLRTDRVVNCAGLHADRIARLFGGDAAAKGMMIVPFRGEYFELAPSRSHLVRSLIYPVPDPQFPFLGVHLTRGISGRIHAGPNAVLALAREGYSWRVVDRHDIAETVRFPGFRMLVKEQWRYGLSEMVRSLSRRRFADALSRLVPEVRAQDLEPASSGVRAQAVHPDGRLADDFEFGRSNDGRVLHVLNAPSPAATASLAIGDQIAAELLGVTS